MDPTRTVHRSLIAAWLFALLAALFIAGCSASPSTPPAATASAAAPASTQTTPLAAAPTTAAAAISFTKDILPIFDQTCLKCHGGDKTEKGLSVKTYADLMQGSQKGAVVIPGDPDSSRLVRLLLNGRMPKRGEKLSESQIHLVMEWIRAGAQNN